MENIVSIHYMSLVQILTTLKSKSKTTVSIHYMSLVQASAGYTAMLSKSFQYIICRWFNLTGIANGNFTGLFQYIICRWFKLISRGTL